MRYILSVVGLAVLGASSLVSASEWSVVVKQLERATVYIETSQGSCTGFVVHSAAREKKDTDFVMSAAHCDGDSLFVAHVPARVIYKNAKKDLLVLEVDDLDRPALALGKNPKIGDSVASYGFGYGLERPMFRQAHISDTDMYIHEGGVGGPFFSTDSTFVSGMSGGPVVNEAGEVVMIVQRGSNSVGIGIGADTIRAAVGRYFEKK